MRHALLSLVILAAASSAARAQWSVAWQTIDGGGEVTATGGAWSATSTLGQPDPGTAQAPDQTYSVEGGFWTGVAPFCPADYDRSGFADSDDFIAFVADFELGCIAPGQTAGGPDPACRRSADFDLSGFVDSDDFIAFVARFEAGC